MSSLRNGASSGTSGSYDRVGSGHFLGDESNAGLGWLAYLRDPRATNFYKEHCLYLPAMLGWFFFSMLLSTYNKYVFGDGHLNFPCPLLLTSMHFSAQWIFSLSMCKLFPVTFGSKRVDDMNWREFLEISIPCGLVTSGDIGLSNLSLVSISITFYTMVKASTPIFVLIWAYIFGIMKIKWSLIGVIVVIAFGEYLTVAGEVDFILKGFVMCLMASILSGARWTLVQLKIQSLDPPLKTTLATMRVLSPFMAISLIIVAMLVEKPWITLRSVVDSYETAGYILSLGLIGAFLAICMIMCEFYLIMHSNAIVLMIGGVIKEILTIFVGVNVFGDTINFTNFVGCCIVFLGVVLYKVIFHMEKEQAKQVATLEQSSVKTQEKKSILKDDSITSLDVNEYYDDEEWIGQDSDGIEMERRRSPKGKRAVQQVMISDH